MKFDLQTPGLIICAYFDAPRPKLILQEITNGTLICKYDTFAPFKLAFEIRYESNPDGDTIKQTTQSPSDTIQINHIATHFGGGGLFCIRTKCVMDNIFNSESTYCVWSAFDPNIINQKC